MSVSLVARTALLGLLVAYAVTAGGGYVATRATAPGPVVPVLPARVLLVTDSTEDGPVAMEAQARRALTDAHVAFDAADVGDAFRPLDYDAVLILAEAQYRMRPEVAADLVALVEGGGGAAVLFRGWNETLAPLFGYPAASPDYVEAHGTYRTLLPLMPGEDSLALSIESESMLALGEPEGCDVIGRLDGVAAAWTCARGAGRVAYWNATRLMDKHYRGHILQTLALVAPTSVRPVANWAVVFIDDFPSPAPTGRLEPIASEFDLSVVDFYTQRWYPDMRHLADEFGVVYTSTVTFNYNGRVEAPFDFAEWLAATVDDDGTEVPYAPWIARREREVSELALHGYNHQSLVTDLWGSKAPMVEALERARVRWEVDRLGPLPTTYVPPMNWIDSVGTRALHEAMPEIATVSGLYWGADERGQNQEFGPNRWVPELYDFPRVTAGFELHPLARLEMLSQLQAIGGWSHFVHPDELIYNADREASYAEAGLPSPTEVGWRGDGRHGLYFLFADWLRTVRREYPWLEFVRADEGARRQQAFAALHLSTTTTRSGSGFTTTLYASRAGHDFAVSARRGERLASVRGGEIVHEWDGPLLRQYIVRHTDGPLELTFEADPATADPTTVSQR